MTAAQIVQSMGFFWLAATGLLLSSEMRHWDYADFVGPVCGVATYLIGRNWPKLEAPLEPWKLMMAISAIALFHANLFAFVFEYEISLISLASLLVGGTVSGGMGLKLRHRQNEH